MSRTRLKLKRAWASDSPGLSPSPPSERMSASKISSPFGLSLCACHVLKLPNLLVILVVHDPPVTPVPASLLHGDMRPRGHGSGRAQPPRGPVHPTPTQGRATGARGRSPARGGRGEGMPAEGPPAQARGPRGRSGGSEGSSRSAGGSSRPGRGGRGEGMQAGGPPPARGRGSRGSGGSSLSARGSSRGREEIPIMRRRDFGNAGRRRKIIVNAFRAQVEAKKVFQYDAISTAENFPKPPVVLNMELIRALQRTRPNMFSTPPVYDGQKKLYSLVELPVEETESEWVVTFEGMRYRIRLTRVGGPIDTGILHRFIKGDPTQENSINDARQALDAALRMKPLSYLPTDKERRIFYTPNEVYAAGSGVILWRGYFQSLRPAMSRLLVNIDISSTAMYQHGRLTDLARQFLGERNIITLAGMLNQAKHRENLAQFITGVRVQWTRIGSHDTMVRAVKGLGDTSADQQTFTRRDGRKTTITEYFYETTNTRLLYPGLPCVQVGKPEVGKGAWIPMELCTVPGGQPLRPSSAPELVDKLNQNRMSFGVKGPAERLSLVKKGLQVLSHGESDYVREFGITVDQNTISVGARVLEPPVLRYQPAAGSQEEGVAVTPINGNLNMKEKHFYRPAKIESWALVCYECDQRFSIEVVEQNPTVTKFFNNHADILRDLNEIEQQCVNRSGKAPSLLFVVLPSGRELESYKTVKYWGDVQSTWFNPKPSLQLWSNIAHKINAKLGGINVIIDPAAFTVPGNVPLLGETMVMGADVVHLAESIAAVVASVDVHASHYITTFRVQKEAGQEMISDLQEMTMIQYLLTRYISHRQQVPKRIICYRDGLSEGQFKTVLNEEACELLNINPKMTFLIVVKKHHMRFFDKDLNSDTERNCRPGTVVDREVVHPTDFDFYLQSHNVPRGTARPAHYSSKVLYDENNLTADTLQALSFALCHIYTRSNRAVSIPAPVHYADQVCARVMNHCNPKAPAQPTATEGSSKSVYQPPHDALKDIMYFASTYVTHFFNEVKVLVYYLPPAIVDQDFTIYHGRSD
ncbi:Piwi domain-containing protein [Mycena epipterygia]|nr:Piwi domain-containing protein [Mycena epipterygia]